MEKIESGLKGKKVVVLGGSSGIGLEISRQSAQLGAEVVIASSSAERVQQAVAEIGGKTTGQALDLFDEAAIEAFFEKLGHSISLFIRRRIRCTSAILQRLI